MMIDWYIIALFSSFVAAFFLGLNHSFQVDKWVMTIWSSLVFTPVLIVAVYFYGLPSAPMFYVLSFCCALGYLLADLGLFSGAAKFGGAITGPVLSSRIWLTFFIWIALDPAHTQELLQNPLKLVSVTGLMGVAIYSLFLMKNVRPTREAFQVLLPAILILSVVAIMQKTINTYASFEQATFVFVALTGVLTGLGGLIFAPNGHKLPNSKKVFKYCLIVGFFGFLTASLRVAAMADSPNPAYVIAISLLASVWLNMFYAYQHSFSWRVNGAALLYLVSVIGLVLV